MSKLSDSLRNIWKIDELRQRIIYTLLLLVVARVGAHVTLPGVDAAVIVKAAESGQSGGGIFGLFDLFVGGAFSQAAVFALGIMPYISASIIIQLMGAVVPYFQRLQKEGQEGQRIITNLTRYGTVLIAGGQAVGYAVRLKNLNFGGAAVVPNANLFFFVSTVIILTAGCVFMMWMGERITEKGIGNGISLIIFIGIIARLPASLTNEISLVANQSKNGIIEIVYLALLVLIIAATVALTQGTRRIPVQYAKKVVGGGKVVGGQTQYIPMKVNTAGVMPIIFAQSILFIPGTVLQLLPHSERMQGLTTALNDYTSWTHAIISSIMIVFFTYFYTAIAFNPQDVADTMRKQGGFVPGIKPGGPTSEFIDNILTRITLPGAIALAIIAVLPALFSNLGVQPGLAQFFGGTSLLIVVGVALDTLQQIESHLLMRHYDGFMKSGRIQGRR